MKSEKQRLKIVREREREKRCYVGCIFVGMNGEENINDDIERQ